MLATSPSRCRGRVWDPPLQSFDARTSRLVALQEQRR
jgi:hypothetical protein